MVESLGAKPNCEYVSPVTSIPNVGDETDDVEFEFIKRQESCPSPDPRLAFLPLASPISYCTKT